MSATHKLACFSRHFGPGPRVWSARIIDPDFPKLRYSERRNETTRSVLTAAGKDRAGLSHDTNELLYPITFNVRISTLRFGNSTLFYKGVTMPGRVSVAGDALAHCAKGR